MCSELSTYWTVNDVLVKELFCCYLIVNLFIIKYFTIFLRVWTEISFIPPLKLKKRDTNSKDWFPLQIPTSWTSNAEDATKQLWSSVMPKQSWPATTARTFWASQQEVNANWQRDQPSKSKTEHYDSNIPSFIDISTISIFNEINQR